MQEPIVAGRKLFARAGPGVGWQGVLHFVSLCHILLCLSDPAATTLCRCWFASTWGARATEQGTAEACLPRRASVETPCRFQGVLGFRTWCHSKTYFTMDSWSRFVLMRNYSAKSISAMFGLSSGALAASSSFACCSSCNCSKAAVLYL